jgi:hypothetical protein
LIFFCVAARHYLQGIIGQGSLQCFRLIPWRAQQVAAPMYGKAQGTSNPERRQRRTMLAKPEIIQHAKELIAEKRQERDERP